MKNCLMTLSAVALFAFAQIHARMDARTAFQKLKSNPTNVSCLCIVAENFEEGGNFRSAADIYKSCVAIEPDEPRHYVKLGACYSRMERPDLAYRVLTNAACLFERNSRVRGALAGAEYKLGLFASAFSNYLFAVEYGDGRGNAFYYTQMAKCLREARDYRAALSYVDSALAVKEEFWALFERGRILEESGDFAGAVKAYVRARELSAKNGKQRTVVTGKLAAVFFELGMICKRDGRKEMARGYFTRIVNDPEMSGFPCREKASFWLKRI